MSEVQITSAAKKYLESASISIKEPVLAIFEQIIRGCCSTRKINQIMLVSKSEIPEDGRFELIEKEGWKIFVSKTLIQYQEKITIDFTGMLNMQRLVVLGIPEDNESNNGCC